MKKITTFLILTALTFAVVYKSQATIINVPIDSTTIQGGINGAVNGDTVLVQSGTYVENINFNGKNITVASLFLITHDTAYISQTIIDGNQNGSVVTFENNEDSNAQLIGFSITNGLAQNGGGIYTYLADPILKNLRVINNESVDMGGGIYCNRSNILIENCFIRSNTAIRGGGVMFAGVQSRIYDLNISSCDISLNISTGNSNGALYVGGCTAKISNTSIIGNENSSANVLYCSQTNIDIVNSIVWNDETDIIYGTSSAYLTLNNSNIQGGINSVNAEHLEWINNINLNPHFIDFNNSNFNLQQNSPCIDYGSIDVTLPDYDINGNPRINFGIPDLGAFEYQQSGNYITCYSPNGNEFVGKNTQYLIFWDSNIQNLILEYSSDAGDSWNLIVDSTFQDNFYNWSVPDILSDSCLIKITDSSDPLVFDQSDVFFMIVPKVIRDGDTISGNWTQNDSPVIIEGESILPADSTLIIDPGVEVRLLTDQHETKGWLRIHGTLLAQGTENDSIYFTRYGIEGNWKNILFYGTGSSSSIISFCDIQFADESYYNGETAYGAISFRYSNASVNNTYIHDNASYGINTISNNTHPVISYCKIIGDILAYPFSNGDLINNIIIGKISLVDDNVWNINGNIITGSPYAIHGKFGSVVYIENNEISGTIEANRSYFQIKNNKITSSTDGIKLYNLGVSTIENNIFYDISGTAVWVYDRADGKINNCTFINNTTVIKIRSYESLVTFSNCVFKDNENTFFEGSTFFGMRNCLLDNIDLPGSVADLGGNLLNTDPQFLNSGDHPYQLTSGSPAINAGYVNSDLEQDIDFLGNQRVCKGRIDIGAYEYQETGDWLWLTSPHDEEYYEWGSNYPITWERSDSLSTITLEFYDGTNWTMIDGNAPNTGEYTSWIAPELVADECLFRITDNGNGLSHIIEQPFHIRKNVIEHEENVSGTWTVENSPYTIIGSAIINSDTLIIEPGVEVKLRTGNVVNTESVFLNAGMFEISWAGIIISEGSHLNPVIFSRDGNEGFWSSIYFYGNAGNSSIFNNCLIEYASDIYANGVYLGAVSFDHSGATISNCEFRLNAYYGVDNTIGDNTRIVNNQFYYNILGGGILCWDSDEVDIVNNLFYDNFGVGIVCSGDNGGGSSPTITNNTLCTTPPKSLNQFMFQTERATFKIKKNNNLGLSTKTTLLEEKKLTVFFEEGKNLTYGLFCEENSNPVINNSIFYGNGTNFNLEYHSHPQIGFSLVGDSSLPSGVIDLGYNILNKDPQFKLSGQHTFSLKETSPCINTGNPDTTGLNLPVLDLAGNPRIYEDHIVDIGAYEAQVGQRINVDIKVFLEGPYTTSSMGTQLNLGGYLPMHQPYDSLPWNYPGIDSVLAIPNTDIVDWVLVEMRNSETGPSGATRDKRSAIQVAFLDKDGFIVEANGTNNLNMLVLDTNNLYPIIYHRNHLPIMSSLPIQKVNGIYTYDFTTGPDKVYGGETACTEVSSGVWGIIAGDGNADGQVNNIDKDDYWFNQTGSSGYLQSDFNMDTQVNDTDKMNLWSPNAGLGSQIPENEYKNQLPK